MAVEIRGLRKSFGRTSVLRDLDLEVPWGQILAILGPNGSGKTTLLKTLATLSKFDSGEVRVGGLDISRSGQTVRRVIGVVTHDTLLYEDLSAYENLRFYSRMFGVDNADEKIAEVVERMGMTSRLHHRIRTLSHGLKKRFSIARALLHDPLVLLLDEPESGLDQEALAMLDAVISDKSMPSRTVLMTTHNLDRAMALSNRTAILSKGKVAFLESTEAAGNEALREAYSRLVKVTG